MNAPVPSSVKRLRASILRDVSRSFYLSLRLLPASLRDPLSLAYLLARATDTLADTVEIDAAVRLQRLQELADLIQSDAPAKTFRSFAALQRDKAERVLIEELPACLAWLRSMPEPDQRSIRDVLAKINEGQRWDVERFRDPARIVALETAADLDRYTYLVAGCVGEFWTEVCFRRLPRFSIHPQDAMRQRGIAYGKGLQLVNILRDAGTDLRAGRCYLPAAELHSLGLTPADLGGQPRKAFPLLNAWRERAEFGIANGIEYACAIESRRVRLATALPALLGARTLALLRAAGPDVFAERVKMERAEVRRVLLTLVRRLVSPRAIRELFAELAV